MFKGETIKDLNDIYKYVPKEQIIALLGTIVFQILSIISIEFYQGCDGKRSTVRT